MLKKIFTIFLLILCYEGAIAEIAKKKAIVDADKVFFDKKTNILTAEGNVEVFKDGLLVNADKLLFNRKKNTLIVIGNVKIVDPSGEVFYGQKAEILRAAKKAVIYDMYSRLARNMNLGAKEAQYYIDTKTLELNKASMTTCEICGRYPQWQFNSSYIKYDKKTEIISYKHNIIDVYGVPVFYMPYFSHIAPNAKPRSGFLPPSYQYKSFYGSGLELKYYYRPSDSYDFLYSPIITQKQGVVHQLKYRQLFDNSDLSFAGSLNDVRSFKNTSAEVSAQYPKHRYQYDLRYNHKINNNWKFTSKLHKVSDKSFLRSYYKKNENFLTSFANAEYQSQTSYATIKSLYFQGLRAEDASNETPFILPSIDFRKKHNWNNNNFQFDFNFLNLNRQEGLNVDRMVMTGGLDKSLFLFNGLEWQNKIILRGDYYKYSDIKEYTPLEGGATNLKKNTIRGIPIYQMNFSYPLISHKYDYVSLLQPIFQIVVSPNYSRTQRIANEDSLSIEINDSNLFSNNRYSGYDRFEDGSRLNYGLIGSTISMSNSTTYYYMVGQSYRFKQNRNFGVDSGLYDKESDVVGHLGARPNKYFDMFYRYKLDPKKQILRRNEVNLNMHFNPFHIGSKFIKYNDKYITNRQTVIESISINPRYIINKTWSVEGSFVRNATKEKNFLVSSGVGVVYDGQCSWFKVRFAKDYTVDETRSIKPSTSIMFDFILKGLE